MTASREAPYQLAFDFEALQVTRSPDIFAHLPSNVVHVSFGQPRSAVREDVFSWRQDSDAAIVQQVLNSARRLTW
jgi:hypothetical protein